MQAKSRIPRRSVKPVAFLALAMAVALISALLIVYNLALDPDDDPLSGVSSSQTQTVLMARRETAT